MNQSTFRVPGFQFRLIWLFLLTLVVAASITVTRYYQFPVHNIPGWVIGPATIIGCLGLGWGVNFWMQKRTSSPTDEQQ